MLMEEFPELKDVWSKLLPQDVQREDDGTGAATGGAEAGSTPSERRANAKREGEAAFDKTRQGKKQKKLTAQATAMKEAVSEAVKGFETMLSPQQQQQESEWRRKTDEHESKSAGIALDDADILQAHEQFTDKLEKKKEAKDGGGNAARMKLLRKKIANLEKQINGWRMRGARRDRVASSSFVATVVCIVGGRRGPIVFGTNGLECLSAVSAVDRVAGANHRCLIYLRRLVLRRLDIPQSCLPGIGQICSLLFLEPPLGAEEVFFVYDLARLVHFWSRVRHLYVCCAAIRCARFEP